MFLIVRDERHLGLELFLPPDISELSYMSACLSCLSSISCLDDVQTLSILSKPSLARYNTTLLIEFVLANECECGVDVGGTSDGAGEERQGRRSVRWDRR